MTTTPTTEALPTIPTWFLPSFYGDIRLVATSTKACDLVTTKLTDPEKAALATLRKQAENKGWASESGASWDGDGRFVVLAPIGKVAKALAKILKPGRTMISAVQFTDGRMEEIRETAIEMPDVEVIKTPKKPRKSRQPTAAVSVAAPVRGCPAPDFSSAELRAQAVLKTFLTCEQIADFNRYNRFISIGQTTGNRYMVSSRHAVGEFGRTLYDLDRKIPLCVHDWDVPASEEMLAIHTLLQLPGWEDYLQVTEDNMDEVLDRHINGGLEERGFRITRGRYPGEIV